MRPYSLTHLSNVALLRELKNLVARDRATTAALLAHIAEVDARRLYAPAGYPSMFAYCVQELRLSEGATYKRITAARAARRFPILFTLVARGRLHLTAIKFLAPHLTDGNAEGLVASAVGRSAAELESMLVERFGRADEPARIGRVGRPNPGQQPVPEHGFAVESSTASQLVSRPVGLHPAEPGRRESSPPPPLPDLFEAGPPVAPAEPVVPTPRFRLEVTIDQATHDKLRHVQALLSHSVPSGDIAQILDRALEALISQVEKRKFAGTPRPKSRARMSRPATDRLIPAGVRRAVWARDQGRCTFLGESLQRCRSIHFIEFDHIEPVARGGLATIENLRLRCRAHNLHEAEQAFGVSFMNGKRAARHHAPGAGSGSSDPTTPARPGGTRRRARSSARE